MRRLLSSAAAAAARRPLTAPLRPLKRRTPSASLALPLSCVGKRQFYAERGVKWEEHVGVTSEMASALSATGHARPTFVQARVIPESEKGHDLLFAAQTGTGKTLAYLVPLVTRIKEDEKVILLRPRRPRALVLVPNRELAFQVIAVAKKLSHHVRFSSIALTGGPQKKFAEGVLERGVDLIVITPDRLEKLLSRGSIVMTDVRYIVLDEADTLVDPDNGFGPLVSRIIRDLHKRKATEDLDPLLHPRLQHFFAAATLRPEMEQRLLTLAPETRIVEGMNLHRIVPNLDRSFRFVKGDEDKLTVLASVLSSPSSSSSLPRQANDGKREASGEGNPGTLVFCNTVASAQAARYSLLERGLDVGAYHGGMRPEERQAFYAAFCEGRLDVLVCTDIAARGLDFERAISHVVMFDFPHTAEDFLHRAGRTARANRRGKVTALVTKRSAALARGIDALANRGQPLSPEVLRDLDRKKLRGNRSSSRPGTGSSRRRGDGSESGSSIERRAAREAVRALRSGGRGTTTRPSNAESRLLRRLKKRGT